MLPIKYQSVQFTSNKKEFWQNCNSSEQKISNRQTQPFLNQLEDGSKYSGLKTFNIEQTLKHFCTRDNLPENIRPGYNPF